MSQTWENCWFLRMSGNHSLLVLLWIKSQSVWMLALKRGLATRAILVWDSVSLPVGGLMENLGFPFLHFVKMFKTCQILQVDYWSTIRGSKWGRNLCHLCVYPGQKYSPKSHGPNICNFGGEDFFEEKKLFNFLHHFVNTCKQAQILPFLSKIETRFQM